MTAPSQRCSSRPTTEEAPANSGPRFVLGEVRITSGASELLTCQEIGRALHRHQHGDYGNVDSEDVHQNQRGLTTCGMIRSAFRSRTGTEYWIQTHGTRSHTIILLPGE